MPTVVGTPQVDFVVLSVVLRVVALAILGFIFTPKMQVVYLPPGPRDVLISGFTMRQSTKKGSLKNLYGLDTPTGVNQGYLNTTSHMEPAASHNTEVEEPINNLESILEQFRSLPWAETS